MRSDDDRLLETVGLNYTVDAATHVVEHLRHISGASRVGKVLEGPWENTSRNGNMTHIVPVIETLRIPLS